MTDNNMNSGDSQSYEVPVDWSSFTSEVQAVAAQKHRRMTRDKLFFYSWTAVLLIAIATLFWLLIQQKREINTLIARETENRRNEVLEAEEHISRAREDAFARVANLSSDAFVHNLGVEKKFREVQQDYDRKLSTKADGQYAIAEFGSIRGDLSKKVDSDSFNQTKTDLTKKLETLDSMKADSSALAEVKSTAESKLSQPQIDSILKPIKEQLAGKASSTELERRLKESFDATKRDFNSSLSQKADKTDLRSYAPTEYVNKEVRALREEVNKKADKPQASLPAPKQ